MWEGRSDGCLSLCLSLGHGSLISPFQWATHLFPTSYLLEKLEPTHSKPSLFSKHGQTTDLQIEGMEVESGAGRGGGGS